MMSLAVHLKLAGGSMVALALLHVGFPRRFDWGNELARLSPFNRQMFKVHCFFICLVLLMMGSLLIFYTPLLLVREPLPRVVLMGLTLFWLIRLYVQWFVYSPAHWRGHRFNTCMHVLFSALWIYYVSVLGVASWAAQANGL